MAHCMLAGWVLLCASAFELWSLCGCGAFWTFVKVLLWVQVTGLREGW
jgi:hypothetical protein